MSRKEMKKFIKKLCPLFLGPVLLTGIAQSILASDERTDLMIGCDEYKPYNYFDENGNLVGIDADLAQEACHRMGYEPVYEYNLFPMPESSIILDSGHRI
ncbi:hypothetical protein DXC01_14635 [Blautia sp. OM07-19]|nr:hypothetical protein DXC01_14635 [Blautia sp. OM07-19]